VKPPPLPSSSRLLDKRVARTIYPADPIPREQAVSNSARSGALDGPPVLPSGGREGASSQARRESDLRLNQATARAEGVDEDGSMAEASLGSQISAQVSTAPGGMPPPKTVVRGDGEDGAVSPITPALPCGTLTDFASR
jgi:hypothetical protein